MTFETESIQVKNMKYLIKNIEPLHQTNSNNNNIATDEENDKYHAIMNRYFLKELKNISCATGQFSIFYNLYKVDIKYKPVVELGVDTGERIYSPFILYLYVS